MPPGAGYLLSGRYARARRYPAHRIRAAFISDTKSQINPKTQKALTQTGLTP